MEQSAMAAILDRQKQAFLQEMPVTIESRRDRLGRLLDLLRTHADGLAEALSDDFGHRSREISYMTDIGTAASLCRHARTELERWAKPEKRKVPFPLGMFGARAWVEYQPKGVVGVIAPWNFPIQLSIGVAAGVFAAGNRCLIKLSEYTPRTSRLLEQATSELFDPSELVCIDGGPEVGQAFAALDFDHLLFTGATSIGPHILRAAADTLTPVTLELGGKSPTLVGRSADVAKAADRIAAGKLLNTGQACVAPDYVLVPREREEDFVAAYATAVRTMYPTMLANPDYTSIVNDRHHARLSAYLDDARAKGGEIVELAPAGEDFAASNSRKMPPVLVRNVTEDMTLMREEIFGPLLPVLPYDRIEEAIAFVTRRDRPLALYYFGDDERERHLVTDKTHAGGVTINDVMFHVGIEDLPFGGVGASGMGGYHGIDGFRTFSHARAMYRQGRLDVARLGGLKPPFGKQTRASIARLLK